MKIIPARDPQEWAAFNSRFRHLLTWTPTVCFWIVVCGSVYGIHKSIESQFPGAGIALAFGVAFLIQKINSVSVHYSTRWLASWFVGKHYTIKNKNQKMQGIDAGIGLFCLAFTASICWFDFQANTHASDLAADKLVEKPAEERVNTATHEAAISAANLAVSAAQKAEDAERAAFRAKVDKDINAERARLEKRQAQLNRNSPAPAWAKKELATIAGQLKSLEKKRQARYSEFQPKNSNVAGAQSKLAEVSSTNAAVLLNKQMRADSTNTNNKLRYEEKKGGFSMAFFLLYIVAMLLWHLAHGLKMYRALRYDEHHPETGNPILAIAETIVQGLNNALWTVQAKIACWMPEDEIVGMTRADIIEKANTAVCADVYDLILANAGINEMLIYTNLRAQHPVPDIRQALRLLKTAKLAFENSGTWTADANQASFFFREKPTRQQPDLKGEAWDTIGEEANVDSESISQEIDVLLTCLAYATNQSEKTTIQAELKALQTAAQYYE